VYWVILRRQRPTPYRHPGPFCHVTNQLGTLKLNFNDGTSYTTTYFAPDWINGTASVAWFGNGRVNLANAPIPAAL